MAELLWSDDGSDQRSGVSVQPQGRTLIYWKLIADTPTKVGVRSLKIEMCDT